MRPRWPLGLVVGVAVAGFVAVLLLVGARGVVGDSGPAPGTTADVSAPPADPPQNPSSSEPSTRAVDAIALAPPHPDRFPLAHPGIGDLQDGSVIRLHLSGFAAGTTGEIRQCVYAAGELGTCRDPFPVNFDGGGQAQAQYQVFSAVAPNLSSCTGYVRPCYVVVEDRDGNRAAVMTIFGGPLPPPGEITVTPAGRRRRGDVVEVRVTGFPPGQRVSAVQCSPPSEWGAATCDRPAAGASMTIGADGTAQAVVEVTDGRLGTGGGSCPLTARCGVSVGSDDVRARSAVVPILFVEESAGITYDLGRTAMALTICVVLLAVAFWLWRRTDWSRPTEAATPELDAAKLE